MEGADTKPETVDKLVEVSTPKETKQPVEDKTTKLLTKLKSKPYLLIYLVLALIAGFGYHVRTRNLPLLTDPTTGTYIPLALDPFVFLRYVREIVETGTLAAVDTLRYYPLGFTGVSEFKFLSYTIAYSYNVLHWFMPNLTVEQVHILYPAVAFVIGLVLFFFFLQKAFNWKVGLIGSAFLTVLPAYLYRTMAGFSDKEALGMVFMFASMLFFIMIFMEKDKKKTLAYSVLSGLFLGGMNLLWGGASFLIVTVGVFMLILALFNKFDQKVLLRYVLFLATYLIVLLVYFPERASIGLLLGSVTTGLLFIALLVGVVQNGLFARQTRLTPYLEKTGAAVPPFFVTLGVVALIGLVAILIAFGPSFLWEKIYDVYFNLVSPFAGDRWALTVAEAHQPYFTDWVGQFGWNFLILTFIGAVLLFWETFKSFGRKAMYLTFGFGVFVAAFATSRYSAASPVFNGESNLSILVYIGSLALFALYFIYFVYDLYKNDREKYQTLGSLQLQNLFVLLLFVFLLVGARSAIRLLFIFAPITAVLAAFGIYMIGKYIYDKVKDKNFKYALILGLAIFTIFLLYGFSQSVLAQASATGPSYGQQWQVGMDWVRDNTPEDAVFAHWWDYGYWVQTGGERATLSDGGNARGGINHWIGRHLLTGGSETEALELLAANEVTHVLMISDEIGKYGAFSSIGADENYDRYSWIPTFQYNPTETHETREGTNLVYTGGTVLDDDFTYDGQIFAGGQTGVAGFVIPVKLNEETQQIEEIDQPFAALTSSFGQANVPFRCVFFEGQEYIFEEGDALEGCLQLIPSIDGNGQNGIGAAFYLSRDVWNTVFTHLYLFNEDWDYFELVYSDEPNVPLAVYHGRIIGPMKIWEVTYPDDLEIPEEYYGTTIPEEVTIVRR